MLGCPAVKPSMFIEIQFDGEILTHEEFQRSGVSEHGIYPLGLPVSQRCLILLPGTRALHRLMLGTSPSIKLTQTLFKLEDSQLTAPYQVHFSGSNFHIQQHS